MEIEPEESRTKITGMSALYALGITLIGVTFLSIVYGLMAMAVRYHETGQLNVGILDFFGFFPVVGVCAGPIIFLLGFALLQRIRLPW